MAIQTGNGDIEGGLAIRLGVSGGTCAAPNHWANFPAIDSSDPRYVGVFVVPFATFDGSSSNATLPVVALRHFYITGFKGDTCPGDTGTVQQGTIVGHFLP